MKSSGQRSPGRRCPETVPLQGECTVEVHQWIAEIPHDAFEGMVKVCEENRLGEEALPHWTKKVIRRIWSQVLEDVEAGNVIIKKYRVEEHGRLQTRGG